MARGWGGDDEEFLVDRFDDMMMKEELSGKFETTIRTVSDKLDHLTQKAEKKRGKAPEDPLRKFGYSARAFIIENIKYIDYRDLAGLAGISPEELQEAVEKAGFKVDSERAVRWADCDFGKPRAVGDCARCDVQTRHSTFTVGHRDCRTCLEENIRLWIRAGLPVKVFLRGKE